MIRFIRLEKKLWKIEHANDLWVHDYFSASRRSILMQSLTICSLVFVPSSKEIYLEIWRHYILTECLKAFWKFYNIIWPHCSNTHVDPMLYGKLSERCEGATHGKDVFKTCNNFISNLSSLKDLYGAVQPKFTKCWF